MACNWDILKGLNSEIWKQLPSQRVAGWVTISCLFVRFVSLQEIITHISYNLIFVRLVDAVDVFFD